VSAVFSAPSALSSLDESGVPTSPDLAALYEKQTKATLGQLEWMAEAMKTQREAKGVPM
jgi:hypothetical protein